MTNDTSPAQQQDEEERWIESEAMCTMKGEQKNHVEEGTHYDVDYSSSETYNCIITKKADESEIADGVLSDLFADPDPLETFALHYELPGTRNGKKKHLVTITLSGYKAELGQTRT
jgi:hypothetical protein